MKHYHKIDVFRFFCACLVVLIHCLEIPKGHPIAQMIVRCFAGQAVPFFFITSGFFLEKKLSAASDPAGVVRKFVMHNLLLYGAWMIVEFPGVVLQYNALYPDAGIVKLAVLIVRRICFAGQGVYWYLLVLAEAGLICGLLRIWRKEKLLYVLAGAGLLLGMIYDSGLSVLGLDLVNRVFYTIFSWSNNVVMRGIPFMAAGMLIARYEERINIPKKAVIMSYAMLSLAAVGIFVYAYQTGSGLMRCLVHGGFQGILLFLLALYPAKRPISREMSGNCRDISSCLYFLHTIFIYQVADRFWPINSPILMRYAIAFVPPVLIWFVVKKWGAKPAKWMLAMK